MSTIKTPECLICGKPVPDYVPKYCCDGSACGCGGKPVEPCTCSKACDDALFNWIGFSMEDRRINAQIEKWGPPPVTERIDISYDVPGGKAPTVCSVYSLQEANEKVLSLQQHELEVLDVQLVPLNQ